MSYGSIRHPPISDSDCRLFQENENTHIKWKNRPIEIITDIKEARPGGTKPTEEVVMYFEDQEGKEVLVRPRALPRINPVDVWFFRIVRAVLFVTTCGFAVKLMG